MTTAVHAREPDRDSATDCRRPADRRPGPDGAAGDRGCAALREPRPRRQRALPGGGEGRRGRVPAVVLQRAPGRRLPVPGRDRRVRGRPRRGARFRRGPRRRHRRVHPAHHRGDQRAGERAARRTRAWSSSPASTTPTCCRGCAAGRPSCRCPRARRRPSTCSTMRSWRRGGGVGLVAVTGASNVTGEIWPYAEIAEIAHRHGARLLLDAAQLAPHRPIDMAATGVDYLAFSGHKLYAPFGAGVLVGRPDWLARPGAPARRWGRGPLRHGRLGALGRAARPPRGGLAERRRRGGPGRRVPDVAGGGDGGGRGGGARAGQATPRSGSPRSPGSGRCGCGHRATPGSACSRSQSMGCRTPRWPRRSARSTASGCGTGASAPTRSSRTCSTSTRRPSSRIRWALIRAARRPAPGRGPGQRGAGHDRRRPGSARRRVDRAGDRRSAVDLPQLPGRHRLPARPRPAAVAATARRPRMTSGEPTDPAVRQRHDHLTPVPHAELAVDLAQVELDGLRREEELGGDVAGGATPGRHGRDPGLLRRTAPRGRSRGDGGAHRPHAARCAPGRPTEQPRAGRTRPAPPAAGPGPPPAGARGAAAGRRRAGSAPARTAWAGGRPRTAPRERGVVVVGQHPEAAGVHRSGIRVSATEHLTAQAASACRADSVRPVRT